MCWHGTPVSGCETHNKCAHYFIDVASACIWPMYVKHLVMGTLSHNQYESMLLYRISRICVGSLETYVCVCGGITSLEILCRLDEYFTLGWISPDCHRIVAFLVISGKQLSSGLLHTLRFICVCVWPLSAVCYNIASSSSHPGSTLVFPGTHSHVSLHRLTSTTQPLCYCARVYHNIQKRL